MKKITTLFAGILAMGVSATAVMADGMAPPDAPKFDAQGKVNLVGIGDILTYKALDSYCEPDFVAALVKAG